MYAKFQLNRPHVEARDGLSQNYDHAVYNMNLSKRQTALFLC